LLALKARNYNFRACFEYLSLFPKLLNNQAVTRFPGGYELTRWPVLHQAIKVGDINAITKLINLGADVALKNRNDQDAAAVAAYEGNKKLAHRLRCLRAGGCIPVNRDWIE